MRTDKLVLPFPVRVLVSFLPSNRTRIILLRPLWSRPAWIQSMQSLPISSLPLPVLFRQLPVWRTRMRSRRHRSKLKARRRQSFSPVRRHRNLDRHRLNLVRRRGLRMSFLNLFLSLRLKWFKGEASLIQDSMLIRVTSSVLHLSFIVNVTIAMGFLISF